MASQNVRLQGTKVGTPLYLAPELIKQQPYDFKIDIWALGCVLYYLAALEPPFLGDNFTALGESIVSKQPKPIPAIYSGPLQRFIDRLLSKKAANRPTTKELLKLFPVFVKKEFEQIVSEEVLPDKKIQTEKYIMDAKVNMNTLLFNNRAHSIASIIPVNLMPESKKPDLSMHKFHANFCEGNVIKNKETDYFQQNNIVKVQCWTNQNQNHNQNQIMKIQNENQEIKPVEVVYSPIKIKERPMTCASVPVIEFIDKKEEKNEQDQIESDKKQSICASFLRVQSRKIIVCSEFQKRATTASTKSRPTLTLLKNMQQTGIRMQDPENNEQYRPMTAGFGSLAFPMQNNNQDDKIKNDNNVQDLKQILPEADKRPHTAAQAISFQNLPRVRIGKYGAFGGTLLMGQGRMDSLKKVQVEKLCVEGNKVLVKKEDFNMPNKGGNLSVKASMKKLTIIDL